MIALEKIDEMTVAKAINIEILLLRKQRNAKWFLLKSVNWNMFTTTKSIMSIGRNQWLTEFPTLTNHKLNE